MLKLTPDHSTKRIGPVGYEGSPPANAGEKVVCREDYSRPARLPVWLIVAIALVIGLGSGFIAGITTTSMVSTTNLFADHSTKVPHFHQQPRTLLEQTTDEIDGTPLPVPASALSSQVPQAQVGDSQNSGEQPVAMGADNRGSFLPMCGPTAYTDQPLFPTQKMLVSAFWRLDGHGKAPAEVYLKKSLHLFNLAEKLGRELHFFLDETGKSCQLLAAKMSFSCQCRQGILERHHAPPQTTFVLAMFH